MQVDDTILIRSYRGDDTVRLVRVLSIRDTHKHVIQDKTVERNRITRGQVLVTGTELDTAKIKCYYVAHGEVKVVGRIGRFWHRLMVELGRRKTPVQ